MAAYRLTRRSGPCGSARAEDAVADQDVGHPGTAKPGRGDRPGPEHDIRRGGGQHQRRAQPPERGRLRSHSQASTSGGDDEVRQAVVVAGRLGQRRAGRGQVVQGRLDVQVQPPFGPPQPGRVHERGGAAGPDRQAHQGVADVTGSDDGHLGRGGQPRPGQAGPSRRARLPHQIVPQRAPADLEPGHRVTSGAAGGRSGVAAGPAGPPGGPCRCWCSSAVSSGRPGPGGRRLPGRGGCARARAAVRRRRGAAARRRR